MKSSDLPPGLVSQVTANWGDSGSAWLRALPGQITKLATLLQIEQLEPDPRMCIHWVGHGLIAGSAVTLKFGLPDAGFEIEARALVRMQSHPHLVRLRESSPEAGWLLMERIVPGSPLSQIVSDSEALEIWLARLAFLPANEIDRHRFPDIHRWCQALWEVNAPDWLAPSVMQAQHLFSGLAPDEPVSLLLHGDLHHDNLIESAERGWIAIDPKGVIAGPEFELGAMLRNPYPDFGEHADLVERLRLRLERIAGDPRFRLERVMNWAYVQAVLAACWSLADEAQARHWLKIAQAVDLLGQ
jgi:streptomycin 6-kinase